MSWFVRGIRTGILTEPSEPAVVSSALSPGIPQQTAFVSDVESREAASVCPTGALHADRDVVSVIEDRCVDCMRCAMSQSWRRDLRWAHPGNEDNGPLSGAFNRSIHVRIVDAGDCGACLNELAQLGGPSYNLHRFGIFVTPTPRQADVLLVIGPVTRQMVEPLKVAFDTMPSPKRVIAVGACAASGGVFGPSVMCGGGAAGVVPVDLVVPGCPPPPLVIVRALREICGQEPRP